MATTRILDADHALLKELATQTRQPHHTMMHDALVSFHRERMLDDSNTAFAQLKRDERAWYAELAERTSWDGTAVDRVTSW